MNQIAKPSGPTAQTTVTQTMVSQGTDHCPCPLPPWSPGLSVPLLTFQMRAPRGKLQRALKVWMLWKRAPEQ